MSKKPVDIKSILLEALEIKNSKEQSAYLDRVCGSNIALRAEVESLLKSHEQAGDFLPSPDLNPEVTLDNAPLAEGPGTVIGRYKLLEQIGEGGFGVVYMAEQTKPINRRVALKIIKLGMDTKSVIARFEAERQALAMMDHPNIAKVFDAGATDTGRPYFVMELVKGIPITEYCDKNNLDTKQRLELFVDVCKAVQHAHQKGIIHRDIKPSNVLITLHDGKPVPKVIDFGIAKATAQRLTEKTVFTRFAQMIGTPEYMSPEQAEFSGLDVDARSDIYSLGVLLYQLLTGVTPFDAQTLREAAYGEMQRIIREDEPDKPSTRLSAMGEALTDVAKHRKVSPDLLRKLLRGDLDLIIMKTLEKDRTRRYDSAGELAADIQRHINHEPVFAGPPSLSYKLQKFIRRHRMSVMVGTVVAVLILLTIATLSASTVLIWREQGRTQKALEREQQARGLEMQARREIVEQRDTARQNLYVAQMRQGQQYWETGRFLPLSEMLEEHIPQPGQSDLRGWEWYYLLSLCQKELPNTLSHGNPTPISDVAWSPNGRLLASADKDGFIYVWDRRMSSVLAILSSNDTRNVKVAWSGDSRRIVAASGGQRIRVWDISTRRVLREFDTRESCVAMAWNPDERSLAGVTIRGDAILIYDTLTGGEMTRLKSEGGSLESLSWSPDGNRLAVVKRLDNQNSRLSIWEMSTGEESVLCASCPGRLSTVVWHPDGTHIVTGNLDNAMAMWDTSTGEQIHQFPGCLSVRKCAWSPRGDYLATVTDSGLIGIQEAHTGRHFLDLNGYTNYINVLRWSPDSRQLAAGSNDGFIRIWDVDLDHSGQILAHRDAERVKWSPQGDCLASAGGGEVCLWDTVTGRQMCKWHYDPQDDISITWNSDGRYLLAGVSGEADSSVFVWVPHTVHLDDDSIDRPIVIQDVGKGEEVLMAPSGSLIGWSPEGNHLAIASERTVKVWNRTTRQTTCFLRGHPGNIRAVGWDPNSQRIGTAGSDGMVKVWDATTGQESFTLHGHPRFERIAALAWSPEGRRLATGGVDQTVRVWDLSRRYEEFSLQGHTGEIRDLAWSPDGGRLISVGAEGAARVWDTHTGRHLLTLTDLSEAIQSVDWSRDGQRIAAACADGTLRVWDATLGYNALSDPLYIQDRIRRYCAKAHRLAQSRRYRDAAEILYQTLDLDPDCPEACHTLQYITWLLATSREAHYRRGPEALKYAKWMCGLPQGKNAMSMETLAAAYAETGRFDQAIQWQEKAIHNVEQDGSAGLLAEMHARLRLYRSGQPYHQQPLFPERLFNDQDPVQPIDPGSRGLIASYAMEGDLTDGSGHGHGGVAFGEPNFVPGVEGSAIAFDGIDDYIEFPLGQVMGQLNDSTFSIWIKWSGQGRAWQRVFDFGTGPNRYLFLTVKSSDGDRGPRFVASLTSMDDEDQTSAPNRLTVGWHHLAITIDPGNTTHSLYIDGACVARNHAARYIPRRLGETTQNWVGRSQYATDPYFKGLLDEFRIYNRVLSPGEILYLASQQTEMDRPEGVVDMDQERE